MDDNGDLVVDTTDPTANNGCTIEPYKSIRTELNSNKPLNYATVVQGMQSESDFNAAVNDYLGGYNFGIAYYAFRPTAFPNAKLVDGLIPAVWISCDGIVWCDPATSKAMNSVNIEMNNYGDATNENSNGQNPNGFTYDNAANGNEFAGGTADWRDNPCSTGQMGPMAPCWSQIVNPMRFESSSSSCESGGVTLPYVKGYKPVGIPASARNFMWQTICHSTNPNVVDRSVIGASITPLTNNLAVNTDEDNSNNVLAQNALSPNDVLNLNYLDATGTVSTVATTLGAYPITAPMITKFTTNGQDLLTVNPETHAVTDVGTWQNPVEVDNSGEDAGKLTITFVRPQRQAFNGEAGTGSYRDLFGLHYGLQVEAGGAQFGCGLGQSETYDSNAQNVHSVGRNQYTNDSAFTHRDVGATDTYANYLAPLTDADSSFDQSATAGSQTLSFTVDLKQCLTERKSWLEGTYWRNGIPDPSQWRFNLVARGEDKTGGTDSAVQGFQLDVTSILSWWP